MIRGEVRKKPDEKNRGNKKKNKDLSGKMRSRVNVALCIAAVAFFLYLKKQMQKKGRTPGSCEIPQSKI